MSGIEAAQVPLGDGSGALVGALTAAARIAGVKRYRRLRRLVPDAALVRRRAAGATLRELAAEYRVAHTTLGRYFARPPVATQLRAEANLVRAERRTAQAERAAERKPKRQLGPRR